MAHTRKLARSAVANVLLGNPQLDLLNPVYPISEVGSRVFPNRPTLVWEAELPAICVYTKSETVEPGDDQNLPKWYVRKLSITVEILVQVERGFDDLIDSIAEKVENLLLYRWFMQDPVTGVETLDNLVFKGTDIVFIGEDVNNVIASGQLTLEATYRADVLFPSVPDILGSIGVEYNTDLSSGDGHVGPEAIDDVQGIQTP